MTTETTARLHQNTFLSINDPVLKTNNADWSVKQNYCMHLSWFWLISTIKKGPAMQSLVFLFSFF